MPRVTGNFLRNLKGCFIALLGACTLISVAPADDTQTIAAQSHVDGISTPDVTPLIASIQDSASTALTVTPTSQSPTQFQQSSATADASASDAAAAPAAVAPPVTGCVTIQVGSVYNSTAAPAGKTDCFQFVAAASTKTVAYVVSLPANEEHDAHLVQVNSNGTLTYLDNENDSSPTKIVEGIPITRALTAVALERRLAAPRPGLANLPFLERSP